MCYDKAILWNGSEKMGRTENVELTTLCLICRGDEILLQNRIKEDWRGYTLPGGHVEKNESIVEAVIREMKEETGLDIKHPRLCGIKQFPSAGGRYLVFLFRTDQFEGEVTSSEEGKMSWVRRDELSFYSTVADLEALLRVMDQEELTEFQYVVEGEDWKMQIR